MSISTSTNEVTFGLQNVPVSLLVDLRELFTTVHKIYCYNAQTGSHQVAPADSSSHSSGR
jgi:hypothetical protein